MSFNYPLIGIKMINYKDVLERFRVGFDSISTAGILCRIVY